MTHDPNTCGVPRCRQPSHVTLLDVPLCLDHWVARCEASNWPDDEAAFLKQIGLRKNDKGETVKV